MLFSIAQVGECLPSKYEALSSNLALQEKKQKQKKYFIQ
jgi:hypothetical protein